jgi:hypothetical protein
MFFRSEYSLLHAKSTTPDHKREHRHTERGSAMDAEKQSGTDPQPVDDRPRWQQIIFDDIFLILTLGLVIPTIFYLVLGLMDLASVPMFEP